MNISLIFAGGVGARMGSDTPKQFLEWNNKPILIHTMDVFEIHPDIDAIVLVCKSDWLDYAKNLVVKFGLKKVVSVIPGGETALDSQYLGLKEIKRLYPESDVNVLIHDGVRPLLDAETIDKNIKSVELYGNAITTTNAIETVINISESGDVREILDRTQCRMARAPQSFKLEDILGVHEKAIADCKHTFIDSASMMMAYGYTLHTVDGKPENIKITTPSDFYAACALLEARK